MKYAQQVRLDSEKNMELIFEQFNMLVERFDYLDSNIAGLEKGITNFDSSLRNVDKNYSSILAEQRSKIEDITKTDSALEKMKGDLLRLYKERKYYDSYSLCKKILLIHMNDVETLRIKVKSLYYMNPSNSSSYEEILMDIGKISKVENLDYEIEEIKKNIEFERGTISEE